MQEISHSLPNGSCDSNHRSIRHPQSPLPATAVAVAAMGADIAVEVVLGVGVCGVKGGSTVGLCLWF